jgi:hypothetical protein
VQGYYGSWLPFLLDPTAAALVLPLGSHRGSLSLRERGKRLKTPKITRAIYLKTSAGKCSRLSGFGLGDSHDATYSEFRQDYIYVMKKT